MAANKSAQRAFDAQTHDAFDTLAATHPAALIDRLNAANVNPATYLATDYINHFNQIAMLLQIVETMPEMADDVAAWSEKTYRQHFLDSGFSETPLILWAYDHAPGPTRRAFDSETDSLTEEVQAAVSLVTAGSPAPQRALIDGIHARIATLYAIVNAPDGAPQDLARNNGQGAIGQSDIDSLFD